MKAMPYKNITTRQDLLIYKKPWPESYPTVSVWPGVPPSCVPRPTPAPRSTKKKSSIEVRNSNPDDLDSFSEIRQDFLQ